MGDKPQNVNIMSSDDNQASEKQLNQPSNTSTQSQNPHDIQSSEGHTYPQNPSTSHQHHYDSTQPVHHAGHGMYAMPAQHGPPGPYNMMAMGTALPDYGSPPQQYPRAMHQHSNRQGAGASTPAVVYQLQQQMQYPHVAGYPPQSYSGYAQPQFAGYGPAGGSPQPNYGGYSPSQSRPHPMHPSQHSHQPVPYYYYPDNYGRQPPPAGSYPAQFLGPSRPGASDPRSSRRLSGNQGYSGQYGGDDSGRSDQYNLTAVPRGPPRKPKQSGHALWVGNLPPVATIMALKDHFSRDFTREIESLFLISKSNCAFVNYRTEDACSRAMQKFHDSRFEGVRLVCRLRRGSSTSPAPPNEADTLSVPRQAHRSSSSDLEGSSPGGSVEAASIGAVVSDNEDAVVDEPEVDGIDAVEDDEKPRVDGALDSHADSKRNISPSKQSDRFFIVKSLTLQDLEQSVRNGIWATQSHNEIALNTAFESAENVYLIFSANKSGEYFGYAKMSSTIAENAAEIFGSIPRKDSTDSGDAPRTIPTPRTEFAPRGHIIDDSARGTIFWEAEYTDDENDEEPEPTKDAEPRTWGKPFKIEWMSTTKVPFYRTRGMRNAWNANREIKIARDGTELETSIGRTLLQLFHTNSP